MACFGNYLLESAKADIGSSTNFGLPGVYCSLAVQTWMRRAATASGIPQPISGSPGAKETMRQFQQLGTWIPAQTIRENPTILQPGMVAIWHRGEPESCSGHIGVVETPVSHETFGTIEANADVIVNRFVRSLNAPELIGFGYFKGCGVSPSGGKSSVILPLMLGGAIVVGAWLFARKLR